MNNVSKPIKKEQSQIATLEKVPRSIEDKVMSLIPEEVARKYQIAAFERNENAIKVAMVDPTDINALNALRFVAEKENVDIDVFLLEKDKFEELMKLYTGATDVIEKAVKSLQEDESPTEKEIDLDRKEVLKDAPVAKLVQVIISHAIEGKASDIHIEPLDGDYRVRFRVDGVLHVSLILPKEIGPAVVSRIKILANLKIDEKRKPQDGRYRINETGRNIDFRISTLPVIDGEKVVMRILDKDQGVGDVKSLGLLGTAWENIETAIKETYGMILITGPTGSGKSTSLYAMLKILNQDERNIITLEDPIEYCLDGVNQSQIKPEIGYTFANGLRTILRQDPNIIMVGEIRDSETAELAVHSALTGHLMFSTLHTNTAIGAIPRLIDMGIESFLLSSSLRLVAAQRLVRKICEQCKEEMPMPSSIVNAVRKELETVSPKEIEKYGLDLSGGLKFYHGKGCDYCKGVGLKGRLAVYEVVPLTDKLKEIITEKQGSEDLLVKERNKMNVLTMKQDGILKVLRGQTTIEEIERVTEGNISLIEDTD